MAESDADDDIVEQVYHYLMKVSIQVVSCSEYRKRGIRKKVKRFAVKDGELYYIQGKIKHKVSFITMGLSKL